MKFKNELTLLIDGNWLLISRMMVMKSKFSSSLSEEELEFSQLELKDKLYYSISLILKNIPEINNIILIKDGGSWRKNIKKPFIEISDYKGQRIEDKNINWKYVFGALNLLAQEFIDLGFTVSYYPQIEGDDWTMYWSKYLNDQGINVIIWSTDRDLQQLVSYNGKAFTCWYESKYGIYFDSVFLKKENEDILDIFLSLESNIFESLKARIPSNNIYYINPIDIVKTKILHGDSSDNIESPLVFEKNNRKYRLGLSFVEKIISKKDKTLNEFLERVWTEISSSKKYKDKCTKERFLKIAKYNTQLVWLDPRVYPIEIYNILKNNNIYKKVSFNLRDIFCINKNDQNIVSELLEDIS